MVGFVPFVPFYNPCRIVNDDTEKVIKIKKILFKAIEEIKKDSSLKGYNVEAYDEKVKLSIKLENI